MVSRPWSSTSRTSRAVSSGSSAWRPASTMAQAVACAASAAAAGSVPASKVSRACGPNSAGRRGCGAGVRSPGHSRTGARRGPPSGCSAPPDPGRTTYAVRRDRHHIDNAVARTTSSRSSRRPSSRDPQRVALRPPGRRGLARRQRQGVPGRRHRPRQGLRGRRRGRRRPGRDHVQDALRVDAVRLRAVVHRGDPGADLRDLLGRPGRVDPGRRAGGGLRRRDQGAQLAAVGGARPRARASSTSGRSSKSDERARPGRSWSTAGREVSDEELAHPAVGAVPQRDRHADLHLRHHRAPQGLHAHPRQLHRRVLQRARPRCPSCSSGRTPPRCCSCRWRTCSAG